ncbi:biotin-independent malonate decarboxylase subunit gamma [Lichenicoccus roseus]|uniref:Biotin-independent malonate decarboxylase subunit gamma n=1 Tax=Lichenicoccus roseus TaxID=2683649 RepID=A0A5R9J9Q6_9PROT|nr:biotin-independent malonate decarboxylase subunit gamma [Lichenicoccus roseus]TLU70958.1 biotin-independent malonate decarboxylase subunit gamma [Lichenicoccus roseus]
MTLDELLPALFPSGHDVRPGPHDTVAGTARLAGGGEARVLGIAGGVPLGIESALELAGGVLALAAHPGRTPLVLLVDTASQRMARRDELLGLNEYLAHLAKSLHLAAGAGHRTVSILYGPAAAGAFIATALATQAMVAVPGASPSVMDLPSIARVTKLELETLQRMAETTPIFAPGIEALTRTGAVSQSWTEPSLFAAQLQELLEQPATKGDDRGRLGAERGGRRVSARVAGLVLAQARSQASS